MVVIKTGMP